MTYPVDNDHPKVIEYSAARYINHLTDTITCKGQNEKIRMLRARLDSYEDHMLPTNTSRV